ncbi:unnamed protein product, partial [Mesorhabditis belari]|uniref:PCI domain-containing protein 2 homolog n=1 Tax=Mesorhabditis belari TaxID=2138241 RepID=A0AAF3FF91_9BILA
MISVERMRRPDDYIDTMTRIFEEESWSAAEYAAPLLSVNGPHSQAKCLQVHDFGSRVDRAFVPFETFDSICCLHIQVLYYISANNFEDAYKTQIQIIQLINTELMQKMKESNWYMPIFYATSRDLIQLAKLADENADMEDTEGEETSFYEESAKYIMECYRSCVTDASKNPNITKKISMLNMTNQLFRIYFKINKLNLLKPLIRAIDNAGPLQAHFSMADRVTYNYYLGRKAMFDGELILAEKSLTYAFRNCPTTQGHNKRLILTFLIPVKMFLGHMPKTELLRKYKLDSFVEVVEAVKEGHLTRLDGALRNNEDFFINCGLYLILEKLRAITFRTLFKKVALMVGESRIPLAGFMIAVQLQELDDVDEDEIECIVATLVSEKKIKGYISHSHQILVLSKQQPFPPLSSITP